MKTIKKIVREFLNEHLYNQIHLVNETRVPRDERVELYKDDNIIVVVPLTHRALQKYASFCQWCINDDLGEWEDNHKGKHAVIIQRNPKKGKKGITGMETYGEIFILSRLDDGMWDWKTATDILGYDFGSSKERALDYYVEISNDINNFATNIVYYSPENGIYDMEDNFLWNFGIEINDIPNVTPKVIEIMDDYLQNNEEMQSLNESIQSKNIKDILIERIPFLKEYKIFKHPRDEKRLEAQRVTYNENVETMMGDEILKFPQYNVSSEIIYYPHTINDYTFHYFTIKNEFHVMQPKEMDDLTFRVFMMALNQLEKKLSYRKEIISSNNEDIPKNELDEIINDMNGVLFKFEEFTNKHNIDLF